MMPRGSPQPLLARKHFVAGAAEPTRSDSDDDGWCDPQQSPHATWLDSEGTPEPQRGRSGSPLPLTKRVSLPPSPVTEPETAVDSEDGGANLVDTEELLRRAAFAEYCAGAAQQLESHSKRCAYIGAEADKERLKPIQGPSKLLHGKKVRNRAMDLFYVKLIARVRELGFCPDVSDPVVQRLCNDRSLSRGVTPAQAVEFIEKKLRKELKPLPQRSAYPPGCSVQLPPQPPRFSARYEFVLIKCGMMTTARASTSAPEVQAAYAEHMKVVAAISMARPRANEQAWRGFAMAGAANTVRRAADNPRQGAAAERLVLRHTRGLRLLCCLMCKT